MERILVAGNVSKVNTNMLDFACYMAKLTHSGLTAVFLENMQVTTAPAIKNLYGMPCVEPIVAADMPQYEALGKRYEEYARMFKEACGNKGVNCTAQLERGNAAEKIITESRFADLLITDASLSFNNKNEGAFTPFIKELLKSAECAVVIAPFNFNGIDEILFAYDGSPSAMFAIKQFAHLFPQFTSKKITVLQVNNEENNKIVEVERVKMLLEAHYAAVAFQCICGNAANELFSYLLGKRNVFVVMGAFGKSLLAGLFKHSVAELVIEIIDLPVFISHR